MKLNGVDIVDRKGLSEWKKLLYQWVKLTDKYCLEFEGNDAPYYYNERANISVLSGAAWTIGWLSLEEFQHQKKAKKKRSGRADLYVSSVEQEYYIEAKFKSASLQSSKGISEIAKETIALAIPDSRATRRGADGGTAVALAFIPVYLPVSQEEKLEECISKAVKEMLGAGFHALAWTFPLQMRNPKKDDKYISPGVFLAAANEKHWK